MSGPTHFNSATVAWLHIIAELLRKVKDANTISPRAMPTVEILHNSVSYPISAPVVVSPLRGLNYTFMAAEALWILDGDDRVETIAPYNPNIAQFSDDGKYFAGAYGPQIFNAFDYVVNTLEKDRDSRQAVLTIWKPNPQPSKDIPCTVSLTFNIRDNKLNVHVFMRSSDVWLGVPYDFFNFAVLGMLVTHHLSGKYPELETGNVYWTAVSSHLYLRDYEKAVTVHTKENVFKCNDVSIYSVSVPDNHITHWGPIHNSLVACRDKTDTTPYWRIRPLI